MHALIERRRARFQQLADHPVTDPGARMRIERALSRIEPVLEATAD